MNYQTISEIYEANTKVRDKLKSIIADLTDVQLNFRTGENCWTIREIVEHLSIVENGMATITSRLLQKSAEENLANDGKAFISHEFLAKANSIADRQKRKVQAPERIVPTGKLSIAESLTRMEENGQILQQVRSGLETVDTQKFKFPHPFFGDLNATEWLALIGGHESRHINQIEEVLLQQR
jgi:uncharacterized damage-inducible protein DinB